MLGASNPAATNTEAINTRKTQLQVAAVARPHNQQDPTNTAILRDRGVFVFIRYSKL